MYYIHKYARILKQFFKLCIFQKNGGHLGFCSLEAKPHKIQLGKQQKWNQHKKPPQESIFASFDYKMPEDFYTATFSRN